MATHIRVGFPDDNRINGQTRQKSGLVIFMPLWCSGSTFAFQADRAGSNPVKGSNLSGGLSG